MNTPVSVTYNIDEDCFMRARHLLWDHQAIGHRGNVKAGLGLAALGVFFWVFGHFDLISYFLIGGGIALASMSFVRNHLWRQHYRKIEKYRAPITSTFRPDGIEVAAHHETVSVDWSVFSGYVQTSDAVFLIVDSKQFSIIPMAAFEDDRDVEKFMEIVSQHLSPAPKRRM